MARMTKQGMIEKQAKDLVDFSLLWKEIKKDISVSFESFPKVHLLDEMAEHVLKKYTNIEEIINDSKN